MSTVLYILFFVIVVWLRYPKQTLGNQPKKGFNIKFALLDDDGNLVDTTPEFQVEQVKEAVKVAKRTVASMRKQVRDLGIKGSARLNKAQCEEILGYE